MVEPLIVPRGRSLTLRKRYLLFDCEDFYPAGGMDDCKGTSDDWESFSPGDNSHILDMDTGMVMGSTWNTSLGSFEWSGNWNEIIAN